MTQKNGSTGNPPIPLGRAAAIVEPLLQSLRETPGVHWASAAGALRRGHDAIDELHLVVAADGLADTVVHHDDVAVTIHAATVQSAGVALLHLTGSRACVEATATHAASLGLQLRSDGLFDADGTAVPAPREEEVFHALALPWIPPELRDDADAVALAREGRMPDLVSLEHVRGDLHMHTQWSDGRDSIAEMVAACVALGYEYIAITDHSEHSAAVRNLTEESLASQAAEIDELRGRYPQIAILHGCEVDIMLDGSLDFPDRLLERLDIVLASLHERGGQTPAQLMARYHGALRHPLVNVITHPANRLFPRRAGYELDYDELFAAAVDTGTALEIDGAPGHLDLESALARRAKAAGVTLVIDSDCHRTDALARQMQFGLLLARRGWVERRHVLNTRPLGEIRAFIAAKRDRRA